MTDVQRLEELAALVGAWRSSRCAFASYATLGDRCEGANHIAQCPIQRAIDDVVSAHNALGAPGMK